MAWEYGPTAPGASNAGFVRGTDEKKDLTGGEDGGQGWVGCDGGRHCPRERWFECENVAFGRHSLDQIRIDAPRPGRSRQHDGVWKTLVFLTGSY
jgi:hypothetical protein